MVRLNITVLEGDGIGPEIMKPTVEILQKISTQSSDFKLDFETHPAGAGHYRDHGTALPEATLQAAFNSDATLLAAMGLPDVRYPDGTECVPQIELRMALNLYAGVRPVFVLSPSVCPLKSKRAAEIDFVIVRESTEGLFSPDGPSQVVENKEARETMVITKEVSERLFSFAFRLAQKRKEEGRGRGRVTCVDKANVFPAFAFFRDVFETCAAQFPDLTADAAYVDAMALWMVERPWDFDVLVTENMFGDILSDLGAGVMGSLGLAPSADIGDGNAVFQPCHGTAPDIAGKGIANPMAMILSAAMMLDWLGAERGIPSLQSAGTALNDAVAQVISQGFLLTADLGGHARTTQVANAVWHAYETRAT